MIDEEDEVVNDFLAEEGDDYFIMSYNSGDDCMGTWPNSKFPRGIMHEWYSDRRRFSFIKYLNTNMHGVYIWFNYGE